MTRSKNTPAIPPQSSSSTTDTPSHVSKAASVFDKLQNSDGGYYAATPKLVYRAEFFAGGRQGNVLIAKGRDTDEEFIVRGVFQISRNDFYFTPDANFDPANVFQGRFADVKLNCRLTGGRNDTFNFSSEDFPAIVDNLHAFEKLVPKERDYETLSMIQETLGQRSIKLTRSLFEAKKSVGEEEQHGNDNNDTDSSTMTADSLGSDFDIGSWPVADRCKGHLQDLISTHDIQPLPVYDENHVLIPPLQYESKLNGALVEVHMAIYHHRIKSKKRDVFNAVLRELIVLSPPAAMPSSPFKRRRLNAGPCTEQRNKGKEPVRGF